MNFSMQSMRVLSIIVTTLALVRAVPQSCVLNEYYADLPDNYGNLSWMELYKTLHTLVADHRIVQYTATTKAVPENVWSALEDLEVDPNDATKIHLIYADRSFDMSIRGTSDGWNREHVWPKSYGVGYDGADTSDILSLRAADANVNSARNNLYYDDCFDNDCTSPAHSEAAADTAKDKLKFMPPASTRGDLARSIFYMALRYDGTDKKTEDLKVCERPLASLYHFGVLSTLLRWHSQDPPDAEERARNAGVCVDYQHNRNPFIDYPDMVGMLFQPDANMPVPNPLVCDCSVTGFDCSQTTTTTSPNSGRGVTETTSTTVPPPPATVLTPGDIVPMCFNAESPDEIALLTVVDLNPGTSFVITDRSYQGSPELWNTSKEGQITYTVLGNDMLLAGSVISWKKDWTTEEQETLGFTRRNSFDFSATSDNLFIFQVEAGDVDNVSPTFIFGLSFGKPWLTAADLSTGEATGTSRSYLPVSLEEGKSALTVDTYDQAMYVSPQSESIKSLEVLVKEIMKPGNWVGHNNAADSVARTICTNIESLTALRPSTSAAIPNSIDNPRLRTDDSDTTAASLASLSLSSLMLMMVVTCHMLLGQ